MYYNIIYLLYYYVFYNITIQYIGLRKSDIYLVSSKLGHSSVVQTEKYSKFEELEWIKDFPIEACRLDGVG